jgi:hypothetical protein
MAGQFVQTIETRQGLIDAAVFDERIRRHAKTDYGAYLHGLRSARA